MVSVFVVNEIHNNDDNVKCEIESLRKEIKELKSLIIEQSKKV